MSAGRTPRLPWIVLGTMTFLTFGGPLVIGSVLRGGASPAWPPDRGIEWATLLIISGAVVALMGISLAMALGNSRKLRNSPPPSRTEGEP